MGQEQPKYMHGGEQGRCSGENTCLPPIWPRLNSQTEHHMWVEFVVGSRPCSEGFSPGSPVFLSPVTVSGLSNSPHDLI